jgi:electron transfer flavoprotein alpha subunit
MAEHRDILVFCETKKSEMAAISFEALGCGRGLADALGVKVVAALVGKDTGHLAGEAIACGADEVLVADDKLLQDYRTETYLSVFEKMFLEFGFEFIIMGQTSIGRDLAPAIAAKLNSAAILDCVKVAVEGDTKQVLYEKPVYGGNAVAVYTTECTPQIVTIRRKAIQPVERDGSRSGETKSFEIIIDTAKIKIALIGTVPELEEGIRLEDARVVIGGGRGIGSIEGFAKLEELAALVKGVVGASRAVCDNGWLPSIKQIGLTGKVVTPELYFAIGISGASQHMAGCSGSTNIIAINSDDGANIFREAHYGILGDWKPVVAGFIDKLTEMGV